MGDFFIYFQEIAEIRFKLYLAVRAYFNSSPVVSARDKGLREKFSDRDLAIRDGIITDICNTLTIISKNLTDQVTAADQGTRGKAGLDTRHIFRVTAIRTDSKVALIFHAAHAQILVHPIHSFLLRAKRPRSRDIYAEKSAKRRPAKLAIRREHKFAYTIIKDFLSFVNCSEPAKAVWQNEQKTKIKFIFPQLFSEKKRIIIEIEIYIEISENNGRMTE